LQTDDPLWYAIYTKRQKEHHAENKLLLLDIETFLPLILARVRRKRQLRPLFPCYLFARFQASRWLHVVNYLEGVHKVVSFNDVPLPVDQAIIDLLRNRAGERGYLVQEQQFAPGDQVRVKGSVFDGLEGRLEAIRPRDRVVVLLRTLYRTARVELDAASIEVIRAMQ